jgi:hypothetical protein
MQIHCNTEIMQIQISHNKTSIFFSHLKFQHFCGIIMNSDENNKIKMKIKV